MPEEARRLLGAYEGLRGYHLLPEGDRRCRARPAARRVAGPDPRRRALPSAAAAGGTGRAAGICFPKAGSTRTCSRSICATATPGACSWPRCRRSSCWKSIWSTPSRRSSSTPGSNRCMLRTPERDKHIVNVSAVEGQFYRKFKTTRHPHTNMAKAALNMMTRTSAADYHADGIHMNSVDTGWVTDEDPVAHRRAQERGAPLPPAAGHRRWRRAHRRSDHRRLQHRRPRLGQVPQGLQTRRLVRGAWPRGGNLSRGAPRLLRRLPESAPGIKKIPRPMVNLRHAPERDSPSAESVSRMRGRAGRHGRFACGTLCPGPPGFWSVPPPSCRYGSGRHRRDAQYCQF